MTNRFFKTFATLTFLLAQGASAKISVINHSGERLHLSFLGVADNSDAPWAEKEVKANATVLFGDIIAPGNPQTKREKLMRTRIAFGTFFGFSPYVCKLAGFQLIRVCQLLDTWFEGEQSCGSEAHEVSEVPADEYNYVELQVDQNYALEIGPKWRLYPKPQMDCVVRQIKTDPAACIPQ